MGRFASIVALSALLWSILAYGWQQPAAVTEPTDARTEAAFKLLFDAAESPETWISGKSQLWRAARSRDDFAKVAVAKLEEAKDSPELWYFVRLLLGRDQPEVVAVLKKVATNAALGRRVRIEAIHALEHQYGGFKYVWPHDVPEVEDSKWLDLRARAIVDWLGKQDQPQGVLLLATARGDLNSCIDEINGLLKETRSFDDRPFDEAWRGIVHKLSDFYSMRDSDVAARYLAEHLTKLHAMPWLDPPDDFDDMIGKLQIEALAALQIHVGPIPELARMMQERAEVEAVTEAFLTWWQNAKAHSPTEWRMERLAARGYKTIAGERGQSVGAELLRAVQTGTPAEAHAASGVLQALGLSQGVVPMREKDLLNKGDAELADALIRGLVASEAGAALLQGQYPAWDAEAKAWTLKPGK